MDLMKNKKGVLDNLSALGVGIAGLAITLVVVFLILSQTAANTTGEISQTNSVDLQRTQTLVQQ